MDFSLHFTPLAQAYLIQGKKAAIEAELLAILAEQHAMEVHGNPDLWVRQYATFTIEDAREMKELTLQRKITSGKRAFVVSAEGLTREASNALLKTLEEPGEDTHFFLIMPSVRRVLPTILSRVRVVKHHSAAADQALFSAKEFLASSSADRLKMVKGILAKLDDEELSKADIRNFIEEVLEEMRMNAAKKGSSHSTNLARHAQIVSYAEDQSASLKMILEYLALV